MKKTEGKIRQRRVDFKKSKVSKKNMTDADRAAMLPTQETKVTPWKSKPAPRVAKDDVKGQASEPKLNSKSTKKKRQLDANKKHYSDMVGGDAEALRKLREGK